MKKLIIALVCGVLAGALSLEAQLYTMSSSEVGFAESKSTHYRIMSEGGYSRVGMLSKRCEAYFDAFAALTHYNSAQLTTLLTVREFSTKDGFDSYLQKTVKRSADDFVYVHNQDPTLSELVIFQKQDPDYSTSLAHQAFIQFFKAHIANPPLWMRDGIAVWFESLQWDETKQGFIFPENLAWLDTVKSYKSQTQLIPVVNLTNFSQSESLDNMSIYYPEAWAFVSFLLNSPDKSYARILWDGFSTLKPTGTLAENSTAVSDKMLQWYGSTGIQVAFENYLESRRTYGDWVKIGVAGYQASNFDVAINAFNNAAALNPANGIPRYYLGLIAYDSKDYQKAFEHYSAALKLGTDQGLVYYALALNSIAQNKNDEARAYLNNAKTVAPEKYTAKVDSIIAKLR